MCITPKCWGALYLSTFSIVVAVEIKLYWLQICTPQSILLYKKSCFAELAFLANFPSYSSSLALLLLELFCS